MSLEYDQYLAEHIGNVDVGLHWMMDNLPLNQEQMNAIQEATLSAHDESKFSVEEYDAYDQYFYGGNPSFEVKQAFDRAWLHHIHCNPHHWQHWVLLEDDPKTDLALQLAKVGTGEHRALLDNMPIKLIRIPLPEIFEMIADWWTFSWKDGNLFEIFTWYGEHRGEQFMHPKSREIVEDILQKMWRVLVMDEVLKGQNRDELAKQYIGYWLEEPITEGISWNHSSEPVGKVTDIYVTEDGLEVVVEHSDNDFMETAGPDDAQMTGVKGMRWGIRNGPPYPLGDKEKLDSIKNLNDLMNSGWDYGVLDHGKHLLETDDYDWDKNYRTTPVDILEKRKDWYLLGFRKLSARQTQEYGHQRQFLSHHDPEIRETR